MTTESNPIPTPTTGGILSVPCPAHRLPPGTKCPPVPGGRYSARTGCQVRQWLAQAVVNRKFPRPVARLHPAVLRRFEAAYGEIVRHPEKNLLSRAALDRWLMSDERSVMAELRDHE